MEYTVWGEVNEQKTFTVVLTTLLGGFLVISLTRLMLQRYNFVSKIYDILIVSMTRKWYFAVLNSEDVSKGSLILDIGIGTATALIKNKDVLLKRGLKVIGVDYENDYILAAKENIKKNDLEKSISVVCKSVYDEDLISVLPNRKQLADVVFFSGSWSLMPDPVAAVFAASALLKPDGLIYITQTFQKRDLLVLRHLKPIMRYLTTVDFGQLTMVNDMEAYLTQLTTNADPKEVEKYGFRLELVQKEVIKGSIDSFLQAAYIIALKKTSK